MKSDAVAFLPCFPVPPRPGARHPLACSLPFPFVCNFLVAGLPTGRNREARRLGQVTAQCLIETRRAQTLPKSYRPPENCASECLIRARLIRSRGVATSFVLPSRLLSRDLGNYFVGLFFLFLLSPCCSENCYN